MYKHLHIARQLSAFFHLFFQEHTNANRGLSLPGFVFTLQGNTGLGFAIQEGNSDGEEGIYVKSITAGGVAAAHGDLSVGDRLLQVQHHSLLAISYTKVNI